MNEQKFGTLEETIFDYFYVILKKCLDFTTSVEELEQFIKQNLEECDRENEFYKYLFDEVGIDKVNEEIQKKLDILKKRVNVKSEIECFTFYLYLSNYDKRSMFYNSLVEIEE